MSIFISQKPNFKKLNSLSTLLSSLFVMSLVLTVIVTSLQLTQEQLQQKKATELTINIQQDQIQSDWAPIKLQEFETKLYSEINKLNQELKTARSPSLSGLEARKKIQHISIDLKVLNLIQEEYRLMDQNQDGQISYEEFSQRDGILAHRIYELRHISLPTFGQGVMPANFSYNQNQAGSDQIFKIFVEAGIAFDLQESLIQYTQDVINDWNYQIKIYLCNDCTKEEIKDTLKLPHTVGAIFVGDLPIAWYQVYAFNALHSFPLDLYFTDLNGVWDYEQNCLGTYSCFTHIYGDFFPEIFLGRLATPVKSNQVELLNNYFRKNHQYRTDKQPISHSLLLFGDMTPEIAQARLNYMRPLFPQSSAVANPIATANELRNYSLSEPHKFLFLIAHSSPHLHWFSADDSTFNAYDARDLKPPYHFYNLSACSVARFTTHNYITGWYIFQEGDYGLAAKASPKIATDTRKDIFFDTLQATNHFGKAVQHYLANEFFVNFPVTSYITHIGDKLIIGDPTLKLELNQHLEPSPTTYQPPSQPTPTTFYPELTPTTAPTQAMPTPTLAPTIMPTLQPTLAPSPIVSPQPTLMPTPRLTPTTAPTFTPTPTVAIPQPTVTPGLFACSTCMEQRYCEYRYFSTTPSCVALQNATTAVNCSCKFGPELNVGLLSTICPSWIECARADLDLNNNGIIDWHRGQLSADFRAFLSCFGLRGPNLTRGCTPEIFAKADYDQNGIVNILDFSHLRFVYAGYLRAL